MLKTLAKSIREYKLPTFITLLFIMGEVLIEVSIPYQTADLVNAIQAGAPIESVLKTGVTLIVLALISLCCCRPCPIRKRACSSPRWLL